MRFLKLFVTKRLSRWIGQFEDHHRFVVCCHFEIVVSLLGLIIHRICSIPSAEASIVTIVTIVPSRAMSTDDCPLVWIHVSVTPVQKWEAAAPMNFATRSRPAIGTRAARTIPPPSE
jgi:hypothetical protein